MSFGSQLEVMIAFNRNMFRLDKLEDNSIQYVEKESAYAENISINGMKVRHFESLNHSVLRSLCYYYFFLLGARGVYIKKFF